MVELAWAAGFYEGEGTITGSRSHNKFYLRMRVTQVHKDVIDRFHAAVKIGRVFGPYTNRKDSLGKKPIYGWEVTKISDVECVLKLLWGNLSSRRKEQAIGIIEKYKNDRT